MVICGEDIQFVVLSNEFDYTEATFSDLKAFENVHYFPFPIASGSPFKMQLCKIHGSQKANRFFQLPGQAIWNSSMFKIEDLDTTKPTCFIYSFRRIDRFIRSGFFTYVEKLFPKVYHVGWWDDLVRPNELRSLEYAKSHFDLTITYDQAEARKYGIRYYPSFYSKPGWIENDLPIKYDVCFVGYAKDRLAEIYEAYDTFAQGGARCHFVICGVPARRKRREAGIIFNQTLAYREVVRLSSESRCVMEVIQHDSTGQSLRVNEAFVLGKKLITNNPEIKTLPQYDSRYMRVYGKRITSDEVDFVKSTERVCYSCSPAEVSPIKFIRYLYKELAIE